MFGWPVLVRGVSAGQLDVVAMMDENVVNGLAFTEFAALVKMDVFVVTVGAEGRVPVVEVLERGSLGFKSFPKEETAEMVGDDYVTGLAVETDIGSVARGVLGSLDDEPKIDGDTLVTLGCAAGIILTASGFTHFGSHAGGTLIGGTGKRQFRDADGVFMHLGDAAMVQVTEALMPKDTESIPVQVIDEQEAIVGIVEAAQARSQRRFGRDAWTQRRDNMIVNEVAVHDFDVVVIIGGTGGIIDDVDCNRDFVFGDEETDG